MALLSSSRWINVFFFGNFLLSSTATLNLSVMLITLIRLMPRSLAGSMAIYRLFFFRYVIVHCSSCRLCRWLLRLIADLPWLLLVTFCVVRESHHCSIHHSLWLWFIVIHINLRCSFQVMVSLYFSIPFIHVLNCLIRSSVLSIALPMF